jgi:hypothetical protein
MDLDGACDHLARLAAELARIGDVSCNVHIGEADEPAVKALRHAFNVLAVRGLLWDSAPVTTIRKWACA